MFVLGLWAGCTTAFGCSSCVAFSFGISFESVVQLYNNIDMARAWKNFVLFYHTDFHMVDNLSIAVCNLPVQILTLLLRDGMLLLIYVK